MSTNIYIKTLHTIKKAFEVHLKILKEAETALFGYTRYKSEYQNEQRKNHFTLRVIFLQFGIISDRIEDHFKHDLLFSLNVSYRLYWGVLRFLKWTNN